MGGDAGDRPWDCRVVALPQIGALEFLSSDHAPITSRSPSPGEPRRNHDDRRDCGCAGGTGCRRDDDLAVSPVASVDAGGLSDDEPADPAETRAAPPNAPTPACVRPAPPTAPPTAPAHA